MEQTTETIFINTLSDIPHAGTFRQLPRHKTVKLVFGDNVCAQCEYIGQMLRQTLPGFRVGIHMAEAELYIAKLITDEEIVQHQQFFRRCAADYRNLAQQLMYALADKFHVALDEPHAFRDMLRSGKRMGTMHDWHYRFHGGHCGFEHKRTGQVIEVSLLYGKELGTLEAFFFSRFIMTTPHYQPLPVPIYDDSGDGTRILEKMLDLGWLERIPDPLMRSSGIVLKAVE